MTSVIIMHRCDKCGNTHADLKSAKMCTHFKSPSKFYKDQINGRKNNQVKS